MSTNRRGIREVDATTAPLLSIGMPVFNGEATLRLALDSLLSQSLGDFEMIVSDNASTDGSWAIIEEYAARDCRVIGVRQPRNIGANGNYSAVFRASRGRYFKWASSNDWCAPEFLARCVAHLEAHPEAVLVLPRTRLFESTPEVYTDYAGDIACENHDPVHRFKRIASSLGLNNVLNGVVRAHALRGTGLIEHYCGADIVLVGKLALAGHIALIDEPLFYRRMSAATATRLMSAEAVRRHHYPLRTWRSLFPAWRLMLGWLLTLFASRLSLTDKARALPWVLRMAYWTRGGLRQDVVDALRFAGANRAERPEMEVSSRAGLPEARCRRRRPARRRAAR